MTQSAALGNWKLRHVSKLPTCVGMGLGTSLKCPLNCTPDGLRGHHLRRRVQGRRGHHLPALLHSHERRLLQDKHPGDLEAEGQHHSVSGETVVEDLSEGSSASSGVDSDIRGPRRVPNRTLVRGRQARSPRHGMCEVQFTSNLSEVVMATANMPPMNG